MKISGLNSVAGPPGFEPGTYGSRDQSL